MCLGKAMGCLSGNAEDGTGQKLLGEMQGSMQMCLKVNFDGRRKMKQMVIKKSSPYLYRRDFSVSVCTMARGQLEPRV